MEEDNLCFSLSFFMLCEEFAACQVENFCVVLLKIELWIELRSGIRKLLSLLNIDLFASNLLFLVEIGVVSKLLSENNRLLVLVSCTLP